MSDLITISSSVLPSSTRVAGFRGTEAISRPYQIEIFLLLGADGEELDLADAIGAKAKLVIDQAKDGVPPSSSPASSPASSSCTSTPGAHSCAPCSCRGSGSSACRATAASSPR